MHDNSDARHIYTPVASMLRTNKSRGKIGPPLGAAYRARREIKKAPRPAAPEWTIEKAGMELPRESDHVECLG